MTFNERLESVQREQDSLLCIGLDVDRRSLPAHLQSRDDGILEFNRKLIEATHDLVCAFKLNMAFFETLGEHGWSTLKQTLNHIPDNVIKIGDGKRGDIGNSSDRYARAMFGQLGFDAVTVSPYMGADSVDPFLREKEKGVFVLALTSNAGSKDFQRLAVGKMPLYMWVAKAAESWNVRGNVGLVVGATHSKQMKLIRRSILQLPILIPGIGAQGGDLKSAVRYGCTSNGTLGVITISRSILFASGGEDFAEAARAAALSVRDEIRRCRADFFSVRPPALETDIPSFDSPQEIH